HLPHSATCHGSTRPVTLLPACIQSAATKLPQRSARLTIIWRSTSASRTGNDERRTAAAGERGTRSSLAPLGSLPVRAAVGNRPRRLQSKRRRLDIFSPRPRALAYLPLGRRRDRRNLRPPPAHLLCPRPLER